MPRDPDRYTAGQLDADLRRIARRVIADGRLRAGEEWFPADVDLAALRAMAVILTATEDAHYLRPAAGSDPDFTVEADHSKDLTRAQVTAILAKDAPLRDRVLWHMLYETAARAEELLLLDVADLDTPNRCATVTRKGGATDIVAWQTGIGCCRACSPADALCS